MDYSTDFFQYLKIEDWYLAAMGYHQHQGHDLDSIFDSKDALGHYLMFHQEKAIFKNENYIHRKNMFSNEDVHRGNHALEEYHHLLDPLQNSHLHGPHQIIATGPDKGIESQIITHDHPDCSYGQWFL